MPENPVIGVQSVLSQLRTSGESGFALTAGIDDRGDIAPFGDRLATRERSFAIVQRLDWKWRKIFPGALITLLCFAKRISSCPETISLFHLAEDSAPREGKHPEGHPQGFEKGDLTNRRSDGREINAIAWIAARMERCGHASGSE